MKNQNKETLLQLGKALVDMAELIKASKCYDCIHKFEKKKQGEFIPAYNVYSNGKMILPMHLTKKEKGIL